MAHLGEALDHRGDPVQAPHVTLGSRDELGGYRSRWRADLSGAGFIVDGDAVHG